MPAPTFQMQYRVTYADCTLGNHVYYSRYLDFLEVARGEFFRHLGTTWAEWQQQDCLFPVVECRIRYLGAARYDDVLMLEVWLTDLGKARLTFAYRIHHQSGLTLIEATTCHACTACANKPKRLPGELRNSLVPYCENN